MNWLKVDIATIANGGVNQLFNQELEEIMRNIRDINMEHKPTRRITLQFDFAADEDRTTLPASSGRFARWRLCVP